MKAKHTRRIGDEAASGQAQAQAQTPQPKFFYTMAEAAELLSVSRATLYRMMDPKSVYYRPELLTVSIGARRLVAHGVIASVARAFLYEQGQEQYAAAV